MKIRPAVLLGEVMLGCIAGVGMYLGFENIAAVAVGGICALLPKLVDSEETSDKNS